MDERIEQIRKLASELRKLAYGAGGQSIPLQQRNTLKTNLGIKILKAIKEYEEEYNKIFGDVNNQ